MQSKKLLLGCALTLMLAGSCAHKEEMSGGQMAPAAQGEVKIDKDKQDNSEVTLKVKHLAPPDKFYPGASNYVVWIQPEGTDTFQNVGALQVDKDLEGKYQTTVPYKEFRILVTPEMGNMAQAPTGPAIFDQKVRQ